MTATDLVKPVIGGARVLVAEGDVDDSVALTAILRLNGFDAREARTAAGAVQAISENPPAVLIVDLDLPDDDGCRLIRQARRLPNPPTVLVITAHVGEGMRRAALEAGAVAYLLKPTKPIELVSLVNRLCAEHEG